MTDRKQVRNVGRVPWHETPILWSTPGIPSREPTPDAIPPGGTRPIHVVKHKTVVLDRRVSELPPKLREAEIKLFEMESQGRFDSNRRYTINDLMSMCDITKYAAEHSPTAKRLRDKSRGRIKTGGKRGTQQLTDKHVDGLGVDPAESEDQLLRQLLVEYQASHPTFDPDNPKHVLGFGTHCKDAGHPELQSMISENAACLRADQNGEVGLDKSPFRRR